MTTFSPLAILTIFVVYGLAQQTYTIAPDSVPQATRDYWCTSQESQCPLICLQVGNTLLETRENDCNANALTYSCVCENGITPNVSKYSLTLPYFICTQWGVQCVQNCGSNSACASDCTQNHPCGAQDTSPPNKTVIQASKSAAAASTTKHNGGVYTGFANGGSSPNGKGAAGQVRPPMLLGVSGTGGSMMVFGALFLGFALLL